MKLEMIDMYLKDNLHSKNHCRKEDLSPSKPDRLLHFPNMFRKDLSNLQSGIKSIKNSFLPLQTKEDDSYVPKGQFVSQVLLYK